MKYEAMLCADGASLESLWNLGPGWLVERKLDGQRVLAERRGGRVYLWTRRGVNCAGRFPEVTDALRLVPGDWTVDGELTVDGGFECLLRRQTTSRLHIEVYMRKYPAQYHAFDILDWRGASFLDTKLIERKSVLAKWYQTVPQKYRYTVKLVEYARSGDCPGGAGVVGDMLVDVYESRLEGVVIKREDSVYRPGSRSSDWQKCKRWVDVDVEVVGAKRGESGDLILLLARSGKYWQKVVAPKSCLEVLDEYITVVSEVAIPQSECSGDLIVTRPIPATVRMTNRSVAWKGFRVEELEVVE